MGARRFCRDRRLDAQLAVVLADRMELRLQRQTCNNASDSQQQQLLLQPQSKRHGPKPKVIDLGDKDAVRRRVRALQKKLREIDKLSLAPESALGALQREKLASEGEVRRSYAQLARELD